ncbi:hypothetical protein QUF55_00350 [Clostridiaceae bacterium HSG29]|nr:hypothetical protein [Clostridiaceae bacterium HSG29]
MKRKKFIYARLIIALFFLISMFVIVFLKEKYKISPKDIGYVGSFMVAIYAFIYGIENIILRKYNLGVFLMVFSIIIFIMNIYMIKVVI